MAEMDHVLGRMSVAVKAAMLVLVMALVAVVVAVLGFDALKTSYQHAETMRRASERTVLGERANALVLATVMDSRGVYMAETPERVERFGKPLLDSLTELRQTMQSWEALVPAGSRPEFDDAMRKAEAFIQFRTELVRIGRVEGAPAARIYGDNEENRSNRKALNESLRVLAAANAHAVDDGISTLDRYYADRAMLLVVVSAAGIVGGLAAAAVVGMQGISRPMSRIAGAVDAIAGGRQDITVPGVDRRDEVGVIARALDVLRKGQDTARRLSEEREQAQARRLERATQLERRIRDFDGRVVAVMGEVGGAIGHLQTTAATMTRLADDLRGRAGSSAAAAEQTSANVQTVAAAAEEMAGTLREISGQVLRSASVATKATEQAEGADRTIQDLTDAAGRIGDIVRLIEDIAEQTNLLALNATIEAARAGDAGKGFAVVAGEVKTLAGQTARATADIAAQIGTIQAATAKSVDAFRAIGITINNVNEISTTIASAVEEQTAATGEIARNVQQAAVGSQEVSATIGEVNRVADDTGAAARGLQQASELLSTQVETLRHDIDSFLDEMRVQHQTAGA
ncbi:HAMP domain-containing methyl-accepting chemotaxis protein [Tistrella bauzanensis]|nr:HAMP domain-containing methyl-accepting chemotaxis protein [Tistrella bauzanensis]